MAVVIDLDHHRSYRNLKEREKAAEKMDALKRDGIELDLVRLHKTYFSNKQIWKEKHGLSDDN